MIETQSKTGAGHFTVPGSPSLVVGKRRRLLRSPALAAIVVVAAIAALLATILLLRGNDVRGWGRQGADAPEFQQAAASTLPQLPPPDLVRKLTPEEAQAANAERPIVQQPGDPAARFRLTGDEISRLRAIDCLTQAVYYEAASEGVDGGRAVAQVVLNRVRHPGYPNSVCGVVYQGSMRATGCQFSFTCDGSLARIPLGYIWARSRLIASEALAGRVFGQVGYATHYHANYVLPYWADSLDKIAVIGRHIFYRFRGRTGSRAAFVQRYAVEEPLPPPPPSPELVEQGLKALDGDATVATVSELPKVEADRVGPLAEGHKADVNANVPLQADLARGELILGEASPGSKARSKSVEPCAKTGTGQMKPLEAENLKARTERESC